MRTAVVEFPDDPKIDEPYRGKKLEVKYEIMAGESAMIETSVQVGDSVVSGYTAKWVLDYVRQGRPIETLAENLFVGSRKRSEWPADSQWE